MAIQFPEFNRISFDEANPLLMGIGRGQQLMQNFMQFPQDLRAKILANQIAQVQAQYAQPMAEQGLIKETQANQYNPRIWESEIGQRNAESALNREKAKYYGPDIQSQMAYRAAESGKLGKETEWYDREAAARNAFNNAQAQKAEADARINQAKVDFFNKRFASNQGNDSYAAGEQVSQQPSNQSQGYGAPSQQPVGNFGISIPTPTNDDIANKMFFGMDTYTDKQKQAYANIDNQNKEYMKEITNSVSAANQSQKAKQAVANFNNAMDKAHLTGPYWGTTPSSGWRTGLHPFTDLTYDQIADNAAANVIPGAMAEIKEAMGQGKFSVVDMQAAQKMKFDRTLTTDARANVTNFMNGVLTRMDEKPKFYQTVYSGKNVDKQTADLLWQNYQQSFPVYNDKGEYQESNMNNWPLYTTPKAIASVQATGAYKPSAAEMNTFMMNVPDKNGVYHIMPVKKGQVETFFRKGAKPI